MTNPLEHKNIKFIFDSLGHSYNRTIKEACQYNDFGASVKIIGTLVMTGIVGGAAIGYNVAPNEPVVYTHDSGEITQEYKEFLDTSLEEITDLSAEIDDLEREAMIAGYNDEAAAETLRDQAAEKQTVLDEKVEYIAQSMFVSPEMSETAFAEYAETMHQNRFETDYIEFGETVDADGLKECQAEYGVRDFSDASYIESCMQRSSQSPEEMKTKSSALAGALGGLSGLLSYLFIGGITGFPYNEKSAQNKPQYGNYRKKPKFGDN